MPRRKTRPFFAIPTPSAAWSNSYTSYRWSPSRGTREGPEDDPPGDLAENRDVRYPALAGPWTPPAAREAATRPAGVIGPDIPVTEGAPCVISLPPAPETARRARGRHGSGREVGQCDETGAGSCVSSRSFWRPDPRLPTGTSRAATEYATS